LDEKIGKFYEIVIEIFLSQYNIEYVEWEIQ